MNAPLVDLTHGDTGQRGGLPHPRFKNRYRSGSASRPTSASQVVTEASSPSSTMSSQDPDPASQELYISSESDSSESSLFLPNRRYPGDGFDFRRPSMSTGNNNLATPSVTTTTSTANTQSQSTQVVDLTISDESEDDNINENAAEDTSEDVQITSYRDTARPSSHRNSRHASRRLLRPAHRGPRFSRPIINDDAEAATHEVAAAAAATAAHPSTRHTPNATHGMPHPRTLPPLPRHNPSAPWPSGSRLPRHIPEVIEINDEDEDTVWPSSAQNVQNHSHRFPAELAQPRHFSHSTAMWRTMQNHLPLNWVGPNLMDYTRTAFNIGSRESEVGHRPPAPPASPPLLPLDPPPNGFTRSPREGDVLICPLCQAELCEGEGVERNQVWVIKACGHVYCGDCSSVRSKAAAKRANRDQFAKCVVDGCGKKVAGSKTMYQLFL